MENKFISEEIVWKTWAITVFILFIISIVAGFGMIKINQNLQSQLQSCQEKVPIGEVINGNLYVGYEEGIRIGYHNFNGTWFRCVKNCEVLE